MDTIFSFGCCIHAGHAVLFSAVEKEASIYEVPREVFHLGTVLLQKTVLGKYRGSAYYATRSTEHERDLDGLQ